MTFRNDYIKAFVESPLAGSIKLNPNPSRVQVFDGNLWDKIESKKYPIVCPHCGAPHNPNEIRCEYCGGYMKEE